MEIVCPLDPPRGLRLTSPILVPSLPFQVVIMAILSSDQSSILLGRQKKWPASFYSCLAGFIEPGESFEEAVRREVVEESGLKVSEVIYHSSQNWPFPAQLMMGAIGIVEKGQEDKIRLDLDNELEKADWFSREEVLEVLKKTEGAVMSKIDLKKFDDNHTDEGKKSSWDKSEKKWNEKDQGSVANVESGNDEVKENKPKFKIPGELKGNPFCFVLWELDVHSRNRRAACSPSSSSP